MKENRPRQPLQLLAAAFLLLALFAQLALSAAQKSATMDEQLHMLNGVAWFLSDQQRIIVGNPPLVNVLEAAPLVALDNVRLPTDSPLWPGTRWQEISQQFLWETNGDRALRLVFLARLPIVGLTLLLAAGVCRWARELYGPAASLLAILLLAFSPNILAHGRLATTDLGATCFTLWAAYLFWRYRARPGEWRLALAGLALGAALATKFSAALLLPAFFVLSLEPVLSPTRKSSLQVVWQSIVSFLGVVAIALLVLLAVYRFNGATLLAEYDWQRMHFEGGHAAFLMGQHSTTGWWYYFPVTFAFKTPIPLMILAVAGLVTLRHRKRDLAFLILPPLLLFATSLFSRVNIGHRYLLPTLPFLILTASATVRHRLPKAPLTSPLMPHASPLTLSAFYALMIGWYLLGTIRLYPHYLAYFNELAGGPEDGWHYLVDSNLDWGQDLPALRAYMKAQDLEKVYLGWFGDAPPERYGVDYVPLPSWPLFSEEPSHRVYHPQRPPPGVYAISATHLQGVYLPDPDTYAWFREREPVAKAGYSIFIYDVPRTSKEVSVCLSGLPVDQVETQTFDAAFETNDLHLRWFDARSAMVLPGGGHDAWYLLADAASLDPALSARFCADAAPWGRQQTLDERRPYTLYQLAASDVSRMAALPPASEMPAWWSPAAIFFPGYERYALSLPISFDRHLAFLGYELAGDRLRPGDELLLLTFWRMEQPFEPPLALFVHLLDAGGQVRGQQDVPSADPLGMETGDLFVQVHRFRVPSVTPPGEYQLEIGVYRPDTMERWIVRERGDAVADRLLLHPVSIEAK